MCRYAAECYQASVNCLYISYGYFIRVIIVDKCISKHVIWLQQHYKHLDGYLDWKMIREMDEWKHEWTSGKPSDNL